MGFLISSILCSVLVSVLLKVARPKQINLAVAIMVNYIVCATLTWFVLSPTITADTVRTGAWIFGALGILLPSIFLVMGKSVESAGIVKSDTAQRLALIIPIIASFTLFGEALNTNKAIALVLVFVAMGCLLYKKSNSHKSAHTPHANLWLVGVFVGYGVIDVLLKQLSKMGSATAGNLMISFSLALVVMVAYLIVKKIKPTPVSIAGGILLGILNFANIYTYISAHKAMSDTPTLVFAGMNMGVIVLGALTGLLIFKEKLSAINALGIIIALIAITKLYLL
ncbi:MAG: EamA/RhaT family transporter [Moraxella sp.]|nr:EamA/RhaT family transporter [Moraxella sp.]